MHTIKHLTILLVILMISSSVYAQQYVFRTSSERSQLLDEITTAVKQNYLEKETTDQVFLLDIDPEALQSDRIQFMIENKTVTAELIRTITRDKNDFSWFGTLDDGSGIFFTVKDDQIASKFSYGDRSYTLAPGFTGQHLLASFTSTDVGICGNEDDHTPDQKEIVKDDITILNDNDCNLRVLIAFTPTSETQVGAAGFTLNTFAQVAVDEANLAYIQSNINITMELAIIIRVNYTEVLGDFNASDVNRFRNGTNGLNPALVNRNRYATDIQILVRRNEAGIFGRAFYIPTNAIPLNANNAYCVVSVQGVTDGRFSFTHEVGHLQGGKHENDNRAPLSARGFLSSNAFNAWRTLMTRTGAAPCNQANSCRIGAFSGPAVVGPGGAPAGNANFNNVARLNATAVAIQNFRQTPANLNLSANETIGANQISNHLADNILNTNNRTIIYQANSIGTMRAGSRIVLSPGVQIRSGSRFRAYTASNACEQQPIPNIVAARRASEASEDLTPEKELVDDLSEFIVYPNPARNMLNINYTFLDGFTYQVKLFNLKGQTILTKIVDQSNTAITVEGIEDGYYLLKLFRKDIPTEIKSIPIIIQQ